MKASSIAHGLRLTPLFTTPVLCALATAFEGFAYPVDDRFRFLHLFVATHGDGSPLTEEESKAHGDSWYMKNFTTIRAKVGLVLRYSIALKFRFDIGVCKKKEIKR